MAKPNSKVEAYWLSEYKDAKGRYKSKYKMCRAHSSKTAIKYAKRRLSKARRKSLNNLDDI
jgi:hypothetical protein